MSKTGIPSSAFESQTTITSVFFGSNCATIGENAFKNCISLSEINTDNNIENIGSNAFAGTNISIAKFAILSALHKGAFSNCSNLSHINISCNSIPENAFKDCISLSAADIEPVTNIGSSAFENCIALTSISIPNCSIIEKNAFKNCTNLLSVNNGEVKICSNAFSSCAQLSDINFDGITEVENNAFRDCGSLILANLKNCEKIGANAFINCVNLKQVTLSKCKEIGSKAFFGCSNLEKVYISNTVDNFCKLNNINTFCGCSDVSSECSTTIKFLFRADTISSYKTATNWSHFSKNMIMMAQPNHIIYTTNNNSKITIPSTIPSDTYTHTYNTSTNFGLIEFNDKIESLNQQIFKGSTIVTSVDIPSECLNIANNEFEGCTNLKDINLSDTLKSIGEYAFKNCTSLTSLTLPYSLKTIDEESFVGCNIKKFDGNINFIKYDGKAVVSNNVLIYVSPIHDISKIQVYDTKDISDTITRLGKSCFYGCEDIKRVNIHSSVTDIGDNAFAGCKNLCEVHFSGGTPPTLGENVFNDAKSDLKIFVPENKLQDYYDIFSQKGYGDKVFPEADNYSIIYYSSKKLNTSHKQTNLSFKNGQYYKISSYTNETLSNIFASQASVTRVILSDTIKKIDKNAFSGCTGLKHIYLSDSITVLGDKCFYGCSSLEKMHIPYGININALASQKATLGKEIFRGCENLTELRSYYKGYISEDNMCYIQGYQRSIILMLFAHGCKESYTVPSYINYIDSYSFKGSYITEINLPQIYNIGISAFEDCSNLQSIKWGSVQNILQYAFKNCNNLGGISMPYSLLKIDEGAFQGCKNMFITSNIPNSVTSIGKNAFANCENFKYVDSTGTESQLNLGNITAIDESTFEGCTSLSQINITDKITVINANAFKGCTGLTNINMPDSIASIGESAFEDCKNFYGNLYNGATFPPTSFIMPKNLTTIGKYCFKNTSIIALTLPSGLTKIPDMAFANCSFLTEIFTLNATKLKEIGTKAFFGTNMCGYSRLLTLPNSVEIIGDSAFDGCNYIRNFTLPLNLKKMGNRCLATGTSETTITINKGLSTPPDFTKNGNDDSSSWPLGMLSTSTLTTTPKLSIYSSYSNTYTYDSDWSKYGRLMSYFTPDDEKPDEPSTPSTPETPTNQTMDIGFYNTNYVPSNVICEVTSTAGFVGVINSSTHVGEGTPAFGIQSEGTSIVFTITLTATYDANKSAEITFYNLNGMNASPSSLTIHANITSNSYTWIGMGTITVSRSSTSVSAGGKIAIKIN